MGNKRTAFSTCEKGINYKIYTLSIAGGVFYVGCTRQFLSSRLSQHLCTHPEIKKLPRWMKSYIKIDKIWDCSASDACRWENYWTVFYCSSGAYMLNGNNRYRIYDNFIKNL